MTTLSKAKLIAVDGGEDIEFMFNPNQLDFSRSISLEQSAGSRTEEGENKASFKHPNPYSLKISNIILDTYEKGTSVLDVLGKFTKAVEFSEGGEGQNKRPPIYLFTWGDQNYLRCFVKDLSFKLSLFMPDGTPVRATVDLSLEQVDAPTPSPGQGTPSPSSGQRQGASRSTFLK
ncbi:hypothetical protein [Sphaerothrix gracilis]|uniref:CIS tube protein n=1 Tax=Sphaerothrix gracilis TaxID=3151835 RepID=UPI0031FCD68E